MVARCYSKARPVSVRPVSYRNSRGVPTNAAGYDGAGARHLFTPRPLGPLQDMAQSLDPCVAALLDQAAAPERLFPALLNALQHTEGTTVLVFEDVHWADNATLDLVKYLGRRISLLRTMLVLSARSDELGANHPLAYVLGDLPTASVTRITLEPLSPGAVTVLAEQAGRVDADLYRITEGNPFFVSELLANSEMSREKFLIPYATQYGRGCRALLPASARCWR